MDIARATSEMGVTGVWTVDALLAVFGSTVVLETVAVLESVGAAAAVVVTTIGKCRGRRKAVQRT